MDSRFASIRTNTLIEKQS